MRERDSVERLLRWSRRQMLALLFVVATLGTTVLALTLGVAPVRGRLIWWLLPVAVALAVVVPTSILSRRWASDSLTMQMIEQDEWRRTSLARALRGSWLTVLAIQWPLGLALGSLSPADPLRAAMAMAAATITLGLVAFIALFLLHDRD